jgi:small multidrug resistance pump
MKRLSLHRITFILAGIYNILWGLWVSLDPNWLFRFANMEAPNYPEIFVCVGMIVGLYGVVYLEIARRPERGFLLALVGFTGKILGPLGIIYYISIGKWTLPSIIMNVTNDFIWLIPFAIYLYDSWEYIKKDIYE